MRAVDTQTDFATTRVFVDEDRSLDEDLDQQTSATIPLESCSSEDVDQYRADRGARASTMIGMAAPDLAPRMPVGTDSVTQPLESPARVPASPTLPPERMLTPVTEAIIPVAQDPPALPPVGAPAVQSASPGALSGTEPGARIGAMPGSMSTVGLVALWTVALLALAAAVALFVVF